MLILISSVLSSQSLAEHPSQHWCEQAVRESEHDVSELASARLRQEQRIVLATPFYDAARRSASDDAEGGLNARTAPADYLSPFLPPGWNPDEDEPLSEEQVCAARMACMQVRTISPFLLAVIRDSSKVPAIE